MESHNGGTVRITIQRALNFFRLAMACIADLMQMGTFNLLLTLPPQYPFKPPTVTFTTKIYHPNISNDSPPNTGTMCLGMLRDSEWKPSTKMAAVLEFVRQLLRGMSTP